MWYLKQQEINQIQSFCFSNAMGVTGESSMPVAEKMAEKYYCINANIDCVLLRTEVSKQKR